MGKWSRSDSYYRGARTRYHHEGAGETVQVLRMWVALPEDGSSVLPASTWRVTTMYNSSPSLASEGTEPQAKKGEGSAVAQ